MQQWTVILFNFQNLCEVFFYQLEKPNFVRACKQFSKHGLVSEDRLEAWKAFIKSPLEIDARCFLAMSALPSIDDIDKVVDLMVADFIERASK